METLSNNCMYQRNSKDHSVLCTERQKKERQINENRKGTVNYSNGKSLPSTKGVKKSVSHVKSPGNYIMQLVHYAKMYQLPMRRLPVTLKMITNQVFLRKEETNEMTVLSQNRS